MCSHCSFGVESSNVIFFLVKDDCLGFRKFKINLKTFKNQPDFAYDFLAHFEGNPNETFFNNLEVNLKLFLKKKIHF